MGSRRYETEVTMTVNGEEVDVKVRALVALEFDRGYRAELDGDVEILVDGVWVDPADVGATPGEIENANDSLCQLAFEDDSDICAACDAYEAACAEDY